MTTATSPSRSSRTDQTSLTREAILVAAERLFASTASAVSTGGRSANRRAGGNNAAVYHFGTKTDLVRAIRHNAIRWEKLRENSGLSEDGRRLHRSCGTGPSARCCC